MLPGKGSRHASPRRSLQEPLLNEVGFDHVLKRFPVFADGGRKVVDADGASREFFKDREEKPPVDEVNSHRVDVKHRKGR